MESRLQELVQQIEENHKRHVDETEQLKQQHQTDLDQLRQQQEQQVCKHFKYHHIKTETGSHWHCFTATMFSLYLNSLLFILDTNKDGRTESVS